MVNSQSGSNTARLEYLDALRGIASLMVVVYHFIGWRWENNPEFHWGAMLFNGSDAVSFFFVLSGLVLAFPYFQSQRTLNIKSYIIRRIARIYPGFVVAVLLNYGYVHRHELSTDFVRLFFTEAKPLWRELLLVKGVHQIFIPGWTLGVEMAMSLLLPLLILAVQRQAAWLYFFPLISLMVAPAHISMFSFHFCLGLALAYHYQTLQEQPLRTSLWYRYRYGLLLLVIIMFSIRHLDRLFPLPVFITNTFAFFNFDLFHITGLAAFAILYAIIRSPNAQRMLSIKPLVALGRISYSLYLCHWVVVVHIMNHWDAWRTYFSSFQQQYAVLIAVYLMATFLLSTLVYHFVEKPFIVWARNR
jgi:peptidoglycan/LPS O-acetylase OafA/YrhL